MNFNILEYIDSLDRAKEKGKYICPVCGENNLGINQKNGKWKCFNNCESKDVMEVIAVDVNKDGGQINV